MWRKSDERFKLDCLTPTFKLGRTSVMISGAFTATHKLLFIVMPPSRRTTVDFVQIVYNRVLGLFLDPQENNCRLVLMEDGAPIHRSKVLASWRKSCKIEKIVRPPNSPNLNPLKTFGKCSEMPCRTNIGPRIRQRCGWLWRQSGG